LHVGKLGYWNWAFYIFGMVCVLMGLYLIAVAGTAAETKHRKESVVMPEALRSDEKDDGGQSKRYRGVSFVSRRESISAFPNGAAMPAAPSGQAVPLLMAGAANLSFTVVQRFANSRRETIGEEPGTIGASKSFAPGGKNAGSLEPTKTLSFQPGAGRLGGGSLAGKMPEVLGLGVLQETSDNGRGEDSGEISFGKPTLPKPGKGSCKGGAPATVEPHGATLMTDRL